MHHEKRMEYHIKFVTGSCVGVPILCLHIVFSVFLYFTSVYMSFIIILRCPGIGQFI